MSAWEGKFILGLTGNIASGKSVVRKMLEHLGAYGIDADALAHRATAKEAPGYPKVVEAFGTGVLGPNGEIDRKKLGELVFADAEALKQLEAIVHPLVRQGVDYLVRNAKQKVVVIEAIKLLESPLRQACDTIWVTIARDDVRLSRLLQKRGMDERTARERMAAQPPQSEKVAAADLVIENNGAIEATWRQVKTAWERMFPEPKAEIEAAEEKIDEELRVERARPQQAEEIAAFIQRHSKNHSLMNGAEVMARFGEKAYLLLRAGGRLKGLVGWNVENLVARTDEIYLSEEVPVEEALTQLFEEVERASGELQCEISLAFVSPELAKATRIWKELGYEAMGIDDLRVNAWQQAARDSMVDGTVMLFKQLRLERILRPI